MIVKNILSEELLTISEVREMLNEIMEDRLSNGEELRYELRKAINHAEMFSRMSAQRSRELVNKLMELEKMKPEIAVRIADISPRTRDELRTLYAKERYTLSESELDSMLDLVSEAVE
ncbi:hypothetical protein Metho_0718 [Methanomethylovorans hollandica DSM 15978]|jgi:DNA-directed RNA polymerase subunit F|uniref:DNA-directed RNA polymerase subunit Rpo4 n=1 Tax=Methanomethylovorans hollandica (strain DSM 15978 / NBRC 107637 / DMS1) TaxID=867904 RepID=L0KY11_METHD|nr:RNA polymerase Rpb4 family protein [Methanomethylovorans hollandica]AGB48968.1 hypothetical protein Metho_0718 [Methanomethylovorans hollandica DSM 15978]